VEVVFGDRDENETNIFIVYRQEFKLIKAEGSMASYRLESTPTQPGIYDFGIRLFPKNDLMAHRQDLNIVKWL
jgi:hypothetical protein